MILSRQRRGQCRSHADDLEALADNTSNELSADSLEAQADAIEDRGEAREEEIDDADVNADAMTPAEKEAATKVN